MPRGHDRVMVVLKDWGMKEDEELKNASGNETVMTFLHPMTRVTLCTEKLWVFPRDGMGRCSRLCSAEWEWDGKVGSHVDDGIGRWEATWLTGWDGGKPRS